MNTATGPQDRLDVAARLELPWTELIAIAIASAAVCVLIDLFYFGSSIITADEERFLASAARLIGTGAFRVGNDVAWEMPGTAILFAAITAGFPATPLLAVRVAQAMMVGIQAGLAGALATVLFRDRLAGVIAALMAGFYPYVLFTQGMALSETPFNLLLVAGFLCLYLWRERGARLDGGLVVATLVLTLATYVKASLSILPPLLVAAASLGVRPASGVFRVLMVSTAVYTALMSPWWIRNHVLLNKFVPFSTSSTMNFYMGNSPNNPAAATYEPYLPADWATDRGTNLAAIPGEIERYRAFRDRAIANIREQPSEFWRRAAIKFKILWAIMPNAPAYQAKFYRLVGLLTFGPVLVLTLICLLRFRRSFLLAPFVLFGTYLTAVYVITIASIRYRLPLEPLMIVVASNPIAALGRWLGSRNTLEFQQEAR